MNTLVLNLETLAASEYTVPFTGLAGDFESTSAGLFEVGGALDAGAKIPLRVTFGTQLDSASRRQRAKYLYVYGENIEDLQTTVSDTRGNEYTYFSAQHDNAARFILGAGIRDNYLTFDLQRASASGMVVDRIEFEPVLSGTRRM